MADDITRSADSENKGLTRTIFKNALAITGGSLALRVLNFLFTILVVRQLGDDGFGKYSIVLAFVGLFQIFAELGMSQYVMREIARNHDRARSLFWNLVALRFLLGLAGMIFIPIGAILYGYSTELVIGVLIYTVTFLLSAIAMPLTVLLTAFERLGFVTFLTVLTQAIFIAFGALFMILQLNFIWLIIAALISLLPQIALAIWIIRRDNIPLFPVRIAPRNWPGLLRAGVPFGIISLALTIAFSIDTVMLSGQVSEHAVGWYNVAYNLVRSLMFIFTGFSQAMVPSLSRTFVNDAHQVESWYRRSVKFIMILSLPLAVGGMALAFPLISFLYTDQFLPAASALQVLIWDVPLLMFTSFCGNMTTVVGEEKAAARIYSINAAANVILNLYAIPRFGIVGAALVTVVTDLIGALQFHMLLRRKLNLPSVTSILLRVILAAALMGAIVITLSQQHLQLFILIGIGAIVYLALILALRLIDSSERAVVLRVLRRFQPTRPTEEPSP